MTEEEIKSVFDELKAQGASDDDILGTLYLLYQEEKVDTNQLKEMLDILGYEFTPEFEGMSEEDKHEKGWIEDEKAEEGVSKEEIEDAKEIEPEEKQEDSKGEEKGSEEVETEKKEEVKEEDGKAEESEEDEKEKAMKMFFNK